MNILKFLRKYENKIFNCLAFFILGPSLLIIALIDLMNGVGSLFKLIPIVNYNKGYEAYLTSFVFGIIGLILTIKGIIILVKRLK